MMSDPHSSYFALYILTFAGAVLFYQYVVDQKKAALTEVELNVKQLRASLDRARATDDDGTASPMPAFRRTRVPRPHHGSRRREYQGEASLSRRESPGPRNPA